MTVTKSIGTAGGRDYSTIAAFEAALPATLTDAYVGECYNDSEFTITASIVFSGFTTTSSNTVTLTAAAGQSFVDNANAQTNALRYNASNGVGVRKTNGYGNVFDVQVDYVTLKRLQAAHSGGNGAQVYGNSTGGASPVGRNTDQCIFQHDSSGNNPITKLKAGVHTNSVWIQNNNSTAVGCQLSYPNVVALANLTLVAASDKSTTGTAFSNGTGSPSSFTLTNVAVFGFSGGFASSNDSSHGTANYCATDQSSIGLAGGTGNLTSKTYANQFQGTASTGLDFRLKSGADLIDAGTADTTDIPGAIDIVGTSRPQGSAWDIGAWEFKSSGVSGSGEGDAAAPTADGAGTLDESGSGEGDAPAPTADGAGTLDESGSGEGDAPAPTADGSGTLDESGSGEGDAPAPTADGTGTLDEYGSGEGDAPAPDADGAGTVSAPGVAGTGEGDAPAPTADGAGTLDESGSGEGDAPAPTADGAGTLDESGSGEGDAPAPTADGAGTLDVSGSGEGDAPAPTADGEGNLTAPGVAGSGEGDAPAPTADGAGRLDETGSGEGDAPAPVADGAGTLDETGSGEGIAPAPGADGAGRLDVSGSGEGDAPTPTADGTIILPDALPLPAEPRFAITLDARSFDAVLATRSFDVTLKIGGPMQYIGPKYPAERVPVRIDFKKLLAADEEIESIAAASVTVFKGPLDNNPDALIEGDPVVDSDVATVVAFWLVGGIDQVVYAIALTVNTSRGAKREGKVYLFVNENM